MLAAGVPAVGLVILAVSNPAEVQQAADAIALADWGWLFLAVSTQILSIGALARQQRRLLAVSGRLLPLPSVIATTYVGGAISLSLPIAGKAAAAVYSYRRFTRQGVDPAVVTWALVMSALHLILAYLTIGAAAAFATGSAATITVALLAVLAVGIPIGLLIATVRVPSIKRSVEIVVGHLFVWARRITTRRWHRLEQRIGSAIDTVSSTTTGWRDVIAVTIWSLINMAATLAAFALSIRAVGGDITPPVIITAWVAGYGAGQLGLTPGGIGIVETTLALGLVTTGMPIGTAIAAALIYRIISFWLVAVTGGITFLLAAPASLPENRQHAPLAMSTSSFSQPPKTSTVLRSRSRWRLKSTVEAPSP